MDRTPITLRRHDSINLTTGVVTRSDDGIPSQPQTANGAWGTIYPGHAEGLRMNDLETLYSAIIGLGQVDPCCGICAHAMTDGYDHWHYCPTGPTGL